MESPFLIPRATDLRISFNGKCDFALENLLRSRYNLGYVIDDYYILRGNSLLFFIQLFLYVYQDIYTRYFFLKCCQRARRIVRGGIRCKRRVKKRGYLTKVIFIESAVSTITLLYTKNWLIFVHRDRSCLGKRKKMIT